jgi:hypothetical protein
LLLAVCYRDPLEHEVKPDYGSKVSFDGTNNGPEKPTGNGGEEYCNVARGDQESGCDVGFFVLNLKCMYCPAGEKIGNVTAYIK